MVKPHVVIVIIEAKPDKASELKELLQSVIEPSRAETTCLAYHLQQDKNNPAQFILYEIWESEAAHQQQFQKPYIVALIGKLEGLLAKPYKAYFAEEIEHGA